MPRIALFDNLWLTNANADPGTLFSALVCFYLKAAYYSGLSSALPVLQTVALVRNVGYPMRYRKLFGLCVRYGKLSSVTMPPSLCDSEPLQTEKNTYIFNTF